MTEARDHQPAGESRTPGHRAAAGWWLGAVAWGTMIFVLSATDGAPSQLARLDVPGADKVMHGGAFGVLALLLERATRRPLLALLLASLYGVSDEVHQLGVAGRFADPFDWLADTLGAAGAIGLVSYLRQRRTRQRVE